MLVILHYNLLLGNSYLNYIASISSVFGLEAEVVDARSCVRSYLNLIVSVHLYLRAIHILRIFDVKLSYNRSDRCVILLYNHRQLTAKTNFREVILGSKFISITYYKVNRPSLGMVRISTRVVRTSISYSVNTSKSSCRNLLFSGSIYCLRS